MDDLTIPIPLKELQNAYFMLASLAKNYETGDAGWQAINLTRTLISVEVCEQYSYDEMVKLTG